MDFSTITGNIDIVGTVDGVTGTLLTGTIDSTWFLDHNGKTFDATGTDTKDPALLTALGIALFHPFGYFGSTTRFGPPIVGPSESYKATDTGIVNSTVTPEPASMLLMGTLLSLAGGVLSRKKRA
jgi:hypothetical protein